MSSAGRSRQYQYSHKINPFPSDSAAEKCIPELAACVFLQYIIRYFSLFFNSSCIHTFRFVVKIEVF